MYLVIYTSESILIMKTSLLSPKPNNTIRQCNEYNINNPLIKNSKVKHLNIYICRSYL